MELSRGRITIVAAAIVLGGYLTAIPPACGDPIPADKGGRYLDRVELIGGTGDGFTLSQIRWGDHRGFERIVLEFAAPDWKEDTREIPRTLIRTEEYPSRLVIRVPGATGIEDSVFKARNLFAKSRVLSGLAVYDPCGGGQSLALIPARSVHYDIFSLPGPARLVVDVRLSRGIPPEEEKYSLRTLPLLGDQQCLFLEAASESGVSVHLLTDSVDQVFGEVGLFEDYQEAWSMKDTLSDLGSRFSLVVKRRGIMETPAVLP